MKYQAKAPLVVDFAGAWTDDPAFAETDPDGGAVLAASIAVYAHGFISRSNGTDQGDLHAMLGGKRSEVGYKLEAPLAAGLGTSAAQTLLWLTLVKSTVANVSERRGLAERAWRVQNELGLNEGRAACYASAVGGITFSRFGQNVEVESIKPRLSFIEELERRLVLVHVGGLGLSRDVVEAVWARYAAGDQRVVQGLGRTRALAGEMRDALKAEDLAAFGPLLNDVWTAQKTLDQAVTNESLEKLISLAMRSGAAGAKLVGRGGGGCLLCLAESGVEQRLGDALKQSGAKPIPLTFDWYGIHLTKG